VSSFEPCHKEKVAVIALVLVGDYASADFNRQQLNNTST